ncbi:pyrophosphatase PpaX [Paenibacillus marchantiophytorum]|uniref:Pyrophosphatase PpaX n=1 Tax=Paenibacillus marchantiophytorum TaxID=1619310 RepID=A0ABQ1EZL0_9BACL|nr:pyrophosphatase PpaX [Paenibacillus marchantiophytorum]GFZ94402.1 pyrophosphatase PpaX [Paenibacillus marchantiophytorum]
MIQTVLFDLDGTIVDTNELIVQSFLHSLEGETPEPLSRELIIPNMGRPLVEQMEFFTGQTEKTQVDALIKKYRTFNLSKHDELVKEFPNVHTVMEKLHANGIKIGIVTSKIRQTTLMGLKLCGLDTFISTIVTVEDVKEAKPHPEGILAALKELGSSPGQAIMVGDSHYDIEAAQNAGVTAVGVTWSWKGRSYLEGYNPDYLIDDMYDLLPIVGLTSDVNAG